MDTSTSISGALTVRSMTRAEVGDIVEQAAVEGWNPGLHDDDLFWDFDSDAFLAAEIDGKIIGGGAVTSYDGRFGFMGFFIVRPEFRGRGLGGQLWHIRKQRMLERLRPGAAVGMDGVFEMQAWYAKGGFVLSHRDVRYQGIAPFRGPGRNGTVPIDVVPFEQVLAYDAACFPAPRERFLRAWVAQPDSLALAVQGSDNRLAGFGVVRRCREGVRIGPLFADDASTASLLFDGLATFAPGEALCIDAPENNPAAIGLAIQRGMKPVFGCARMYMGPIPNFASDHVFGVSSFELG
jgi:GNAT superfamily N-acetyltransferase